MLQILSSAMVAWTISLAALMMAGAAQADHCAGDLQCEFEEQVLSNITTDPENNPFSSFTGGEARACSDPSLKAAGEAYCFDAFFFTAHDGIKIDMTVYVPSREALNEAAQAVASSGSGSSAGTSRGKPRCKGCKVERKGYKRDTKPACRGCKVERSTAAGGVRFDASPANDGLSALGFAPLIVHSHGFGGAKQANLDVPAAQISEQAARDLWRDKGYFVISFSERGFGETEDLIQMMNPLKEGLDANEVVDWAVKHLRENIADVASRFEGGAQTSDDTSSEIATDDWSESSLLMGDHQGRLVQGKDDPRVGSTGYSYGGHFQYTATHAPKVPGAPEKYEQRTRWDAINPQGTWFDLRHSLAHHDVAKSAWIAIMSEFALQGSNEQSLPAGQAPRQPPDAIVNGLSSASTTGEVSTYLLELFKFHSAVNYCDPENNLANPDRTEVPVFHIQGLADTLFNFNEGYDNALCMRNAGNDVRYLAVLGGHLLPAISPGHHSGEVGMSLDEVVHCGTEGGVPVRYSVRQMIVDWFEDKLRYQTGAASYIPKVCVVQENLEGENTAALKGNSEDYTASGAPMDPTADATRFAVEGVVYEDLDQVLIGTDNPTAHEYDFNGVRIITTPALTQSAFVCLYESTLGNEAIVGIPTMRLQVDTQVPISAGLGTALGLSGIGVSGTGDPIFFVGIGVRPNVDGADCGDNGEVTLSLQSSSGSVDTGLEQLLGPLSGLTTGLSTALSLAGLPALDVGKLAELVHDQLTAIKGFKFPYELDPLTERPTDEAGALANPVECASGAPCGYPWLTWNDEKDGSDPDKQNVGFGCAPNTTAGDSGIPDTTAGVNDICSEYDEFGRIAGVSRRLQPGDQVGLYFYGSSLQYALSGDKVPDLDMTLSGKVRLPIISVGATPDNAATNAKYGQKAANTQ